MTNQMDFTRRQINTFFLSSVIGSAFSGQHVETDSTIWQSVQGDAAHTGYCGPGRAGNVAAGVHWEVNLEGDIRASPVVADGAVIVATTDGRVAAFEFEDGTKRWEREGTAEIWRAPTIDSDTVYINLDEASIHAIDLQTGEDQWQTDLDGRLNVNAGPLLAGESLYASTGFMYSIDPRTGEIRWKRNPDTGAPFEIAAEDGRIFLASTGIAEALDTSDGSQLWTTELGQPIWGPPTIAEDVYLPLGPPNAITAFSKDTGDLKWRTPVTEEPMDTFVASPIVTADSIIAADRQGNVAAVTRTDGSVQWRYSIEGHLTHHPVACGETVFLPIEEEIVALSMTSGDIRWQATVGELPTSPALVGDRLVVTARDGKLIALGDEPGRFDSWNAELGVGLAGLAGLGGYGAYRYYSSRRSMEQV